jgi:hypothetical protein
MHCMKCAFTHMCACVLCCYDFSVAMCVSACVCVCKIFSETSVTVPLTQSGKIFQRLWNQHSIRATTMLNCGVNGMSLNENYARKQITNFVAMRTEAFKEEHFVSSFHEVFQNSKLSYDSKQTGNTFIKL